jgi:hypothetical protein
MNIIKRDKWVRRSSKELAYSQCSICMSKVNNKLYMGHNFSPQGKIVNSIFLCSKCESENTCEVNEKALVKKHKYPYKKPEVIYAVKEG